MRRHVDHLRSGQNPTWREAWEERLAPADRRRIRQAAWRGRQLDDPLEAALLCGYVQRHLRADTTRLLLGAPLVAVTFGFWIAVHCLWQPVTGLCISWLAMTLMVPAGVVFAVWRHRRFRHAARINDPTRS